MRISLLLTALLVTSAGCLTIKPLGPMKNVFPDKKADEQVLEPIVQQAPRPTPPAMLVTPGEVAEGNSQAVIEKLKQELEQDRRSLDAMPKSSEVSFVKGKR
jgi:hypothetical protein